ncbi:MAG: hypothetical protein ACE5DX_05220 [Candidatus Dojkabacteria bacterium]
MATADVLSASPSFADLLKAMPLQDLDMGNNGIHGEPGQRLELVDISLPPGKQIRRGEYFAGMSSPVSEIMPGSEVSPSDFTEAMKRNELMSYSETEMPDLLRTTVTQEGGTPVFNVEKDNLTLRVMHGAANEHSLAMSELAAREYAFDDEKNRVSYQSHLYEIMRPIFAIESDTPYSVKIVEDCLASADTIMGLLSIMEDRTTLQTQGENIRIDVAVATAQGVMALEKFAEANNIHLELNVGYMAFGLSEGEPVPNTEARRHSNYISYMREQFDILPEETRLRLLGGIDRDTVNEGLPEDFDASIFAQAVYALTTDILFEHYCAVVGDMGDAAKGVTSSIAGDRVPWNSLRVDPHGVHPRARQEWPASTYVPDNPTTIYLANGGFLMSIMLEYYRQQNLAGDEREPDNVLNMSAKRMHDQTWGYGVIIDHVPDAIKEAA